MTFHGLRDERGDDNVAAALIYSALLLLTWATLQVAVVLLGRGAALEAARDGVDTARLPPVDTAAAEARARDYTTRATGPWLTNVNADATGSGQAISVTVAGDAVSLVPFARFAISQTASGPIEQLQP
jgi:hypothetical protein